VPVDLDRVWHVANVIQQHIFVGLDDAHFGIIQVFRHPVRGNKYFGMNISVMAISCSSRMNLKDDFPSSSFR